MRSGARATRGSEWAVAGGDPTRLDEFQRRVGLVTRTQQGREVCPNALEVVQRASVRHQLVGMKVSLEHQRPTLDATQHLPELRHERGKESGAGGNVYVVGRSANRVPELRDMPRLAGQLEAADKAPQNRRGNKAWNLK